MAPKLIDGPVGPSVPFPFRPAPPPPALDQNQSDQEVLKNKRKRGPRRRGKRGTNEPRVESDSQFSHSDIFIPVDLDQKKERPSIILLNVTSKDQFDQILQVINKIIADNVASGSPPANGSFNPIENKGFITYPSAEIFRTVSPLLKICLRNTNIRSIENQENKIIKFTDIGLEKLNADKNLILKINNNLKRCRTQLRSDEKDGVVQYSFKVPDSADPAQIYDTVCSAILKQLNEQHSSSESSSNESQDASALSFDSSSIESTSHPSETGVDPSSSTFSSFSFSSIFSFFRPSEPEK